MADKTYKVSDIPGLKQAADAAALTDVWVPTYYSDENGNTYYAGGDWGKDVDPQKKQSYIDNALQDPVKWVANNVNWSGIGHGGDFSALDDQIKYLKDNKYDTSTLDKNAFNQYNLTKQILAQGTTGKWTGAGFGSPTENAKQMARVLSSAGIEDIKDFGKITRPRYGAVQVTQEMGPERDYEGFQIPTGKYYTADEQGNKTYIDPNSVRREQVPDGDGNYIPIFMGYNVPMGDEETVYGNKNTKQAITQDYNAASGNIFSGTYAGHGRTNYGVQFAADGTPYFYSQFGGDTSSMADIAPLISMLSVIPSPLQPFAAAANAIIAIDNGNTLGGLAALAGIPGVSEAASAAGLANVVSGIQTANQVVNLVNAVESGNILGAITSGAGLVGAGSVASGAADAASVAKALESGDPLAILSSGAKATGLLSTAITEGGLTVSDALKAAGLAKAIEGGDPAAIIKAVTGLADSKTFKSSFDSPNTPITATGEKVADVVGDNFVAEITNPDSTNFIGDAESALNDIFSQPSVQVASSDDDTSLKAIEDLRNAGLVEDQDAVKILGESGDIVKDENKVNEPASEVTTLPPDEDGNQYVIDGSGRVVDIIPPEEGQGETTTLPFQGPMGPLTEDKINRYNEEFAKYLDYLQAGEPDAPNYGPGPIGMTGDYWDEFDQNLKTMMDEGRLPSQWQEDAEGNFTYIDDDGSTLTIGPDGEVIHYTDAPVGNLPGETPPPPPPPPPTPPPPPPPPPTPPPKTTTPAPPAPAPPAPSPSPAPAAQSGMDVNALMALLASMGGTPAPAPAPQVEYSKMPEFDVTKAFSPTLYAEREKAVNPYLRGLTEEE